uniref:LptF/LptG family permease n=2 Tax=Gelidibacter sp. TaxID=2018083 RepID=UPI00404BA3AA
MKILDRYILSTYLKTFLSVFVILMLIFVLQAIWLYISELAGKDLDVLVVLKFLLYITPTLIPLILPLTILLASIMVFGAFAENYEFAAMKSTGISLQRAMRGLSIFIVLLSIVTFFFSNNVIPWAHYESYNLRKNIAKLKPALAIAEGQFNEIGNYNIKVETKSGERGQYLKQAIMHERQNRRTGNFKVIYADSGELKSNENSNVLQLLLFNGNYYEEVYSKDPKEAQKKPHAKSYFETYTLNIDLEFLNSDVDLEEKSANNRYNMLDVSGLNYYIDSLNTNKSKDYKELSQTLYDRTAINNLNANIAPIKDTIFTGNVLDLFTARNSVQALNLAINSMNSTKQIISTKEQTFTFSNKLINKHVIALHEKYALAIACIILFFVGAPLGALIRKGGIGLPLVIAILLFLSYHFIGLFAKNSAENDTIHPILGTWLSTLIMLPLGIYLTRRATNDKGLFEFDSFLEPLKKFLNLKPKNTITINGELINYGFLEGYKTERLIDVIKNYETLNHDRSIIPFAFNILSKRGISIETLETNGISVHPDYIAAKKEATDTIDYSRFAMLFFIIGITLLILHFVFKNNKLPEASSAAIDLSLICISIYVLYFVVTYIKSQLFYKHFKTATKPVNIFLLLLGFPLYFVTHYLLRNKIREDLDVCCLENVK